MNDKMKMADVFLARPIRLRLNSMAVYGGTQPIEPTEISGRVSIGIDQTVKLLPEMARVDGKWVELEPDSITLFAPNILGIVFHPAE